MLVSRMKTTRRSFLATSSSAALAQTGAQRPNILYIMTDQQHWQMMSCTGNRWLKTPAMDSLAASGTSFDLAYSSNPVCVPARTAMMTGRYPSYFEFDGNVPPKHPPQQADLAKAMGHVFREAGYRTVFGGKTHWPKPMTLDTIGFEDLTRDERDELAGKAAAFLTEKHDKPFRLVASFINPHDICYMAIDSFRKATAHETMYPKSTIERQRVNEAQQLPAGVSREEFFARHCPPLPANHGHTSDEPASFSKFQSFRGYVRQHWTGEQWRLHRWTYCRLTERVDAEIGHVLSALRRSGLDKNTVVVFASDHGDMDSAHGFEHKSLPYDESARVPFIVSWPGRVPAGKIDRKHLISSCVDLLPTLCDFAGIQPPSGLPGRSIKPLAIGKAPSDWRREVLIEFTGGRTVRGARYKYSRWNDGAEMLIDMENDPGERKNLAPDPTMASVLEEHRRLLTKVTPAGHSPGAATARSSGEGA